MKILLVEDDEIFIENLSTCLIQQNYTVETVTKANQGWEYAQATKYDLIVLDINLPDSDGISLCQKLRQSHYKGAILLLTAKTDDISKVNGLDAGADDYVIKSCTAEELCARIRALLRRPRELTTTVLQWGELQLDPRTCQVSYCHQAIALSPKEYGLLEIFLRHPQQIFNSDILLERLWSFDETPGNETVRTHIKRLRRKLKRAGVDPVIENIYGMGYRLMAPPESTAVAPSELPRSSQAAAAPTSPATVTPFAPDAARQAAITALEKFRPLLLERLTVLDQAVAAFEADSWSPTWQQDAYRAAHKLAGSLGLFGLTEGTQISQILETLLQSDTSFAALEVHRPSFSTLVRQLHQAIDPALATASPPTPEFRQPAAATTAVLPLLLLAISDQADWLTELAAITADSAYQLSTTPLHQAQAQLAQLSPHVVVLDMTAPTPWQDCLEFLSELANNDSNRLVLAITDTDDFSTRLAVTRCGRNCLCLPKSTNPQQMVADAIEQYWQRATTTLRILAIDDDPTVLAMLDQQLSSHGMQVTTLDNPHQLWEVLSAHQPDLLLLDFEMPNVNGVELCQVIRSDRQWQHLPILFLSAHRDADVIQQMYTAGADDYIAKPFTPSDLMTRIRNRIYRSRTLRI